MIRADTVRDSADCQIATYCCTHDQLPRLYALFDQSA